MADHAYAAEAVGGLSLAHVVKEFDQKIEEVRLENKVLDSKVDKILNLLTTTSGKVIQDQSEVTDVQNASEVETSMEAGEAVASNQTNDNPLGVGAKRTHDLDLDEDETELFSGDSPKPPSKRKAKRNNLESEKVSLSNEALELVNSNDEVLDLHPGFEEIQSLYGKFNNEQDMPADTEENLANYVNTRFRSSLSHSHDKELVEEFPIPENCFNLHVPEVNEPVWKCMSKHQKICDCSSKNIQRDLSASGASLTKVISGLKELKDCAEGSEAKASISGFISDVGKSLALMGSAFHNISLKRRRDIRPSLNPVMAELCADSHPVSSKLLFGEDLSFAVREIYDHRKVQSQIGRNNNFSFRGRGRGLRGKPQFGASKFQFNFRTNGQFKGHPNQSKRGRGQPRGRGGAF